jgi:hypothetical protein
MQGASVDPSGRLRVVDSAPSSDAKFNGGIAFEPDGRMCIVTAGIPPVGDPSVGSLKLKNDGRVWVATTGGAASVWNKAMPFNSAGQLLGYLDTIVPPLAAFNDGIAMGQDGVFMTTTPAPPAPTTRFDLTQFPLDPRVTIVRNSVGTYWGANGNLLTAAINEPRPYRKPTGGAILGLMIEETSTNLVPNSIGAGAIAGTPGTPGTLPTGWSCSSAGNGISRDIVGAGIDAGIPYVDIRYYGTPTSSIALTIIPTATNIIPTVAGDVMSYKSACRLVGGSMNNLSAQWSVLWVDSGGTGQGPSPSYSVVPTNAPLNEQIFEKTLTTQDGAGVTTNVQLRFRIQATVNLPIDYTIRVALWQVEKSTFSSSYIATSATAATRQYDVPLVQGSNFTDWYNNIEGTVVAKFMAPVISGYNAGVWIFDDGATQNEKQYNYGGVASSFSANVSQATLNTEAGMLGGVPHTTAFGYKVNDFAASRDGAAPLTDNVGLVPIAGVNNRMWIGPSISGLKQPNGYVASIDYWNTRLPDDIIKGLSAR